MRGKKRMTRHAWDRWLERFDEFDLDKELAAAIPWGGQLHGDESWLAPCGAVFIVSGSNVRTVLTRAQALANMQHFVRRALLEESHPTTAEGPPIEEPIVEEFPVARLRQIAVDHALRLSWKCKQAKNELRLAGFNPADTTQREVYLTAYFAERRRLLGTAAKAI